MARAEKNLIGNASEPPPPPPAAKIPTATYAAPFLCADIATVIVHANTKPISLKNGSWGRMELYVAEERKLAAQLEEMPSWVGTNI